MANKIRFLELSRTWYWQFIGIFSFTWLFVSWITIFHYLFSFILILSLDFNMTCQKTGLPPQKEDFKVIFAHSSSRPAILLLIYLSNSNSEWLFLKTSPCHIPWFPATYGYLYSLLSSGRGGWVLSRLLPVFLSGTPILTGNQASYNNFPLSNFIIIC